VKSGLAIKPFWVILIIISLSLFSGCSSHERRARETALAIEKMDDEHRRYVQNRYSNRDVESVWVEKRELVDGIVARVNNDIILYSEVEKLSRILMKRAGTRLKEDPLQKRQTQEQVLDRLIEIKLIEQRAKELGISIKESEIRDTVEKIRNQSGLSPDGFIASLAKDGVTYQEYIAQVKRELQKNRLLDIEVRPRIQVSDEKCMDYYKRHIEEFAGKGRVRLQQIVLLTDRQKLDEEEVESMRKKLQLIRDEVMNGADFGEMARRYSQTPDGKDGGDLGYFRKGEILPELENIAFSLQVGEVSQVIRKEIGFHLIRVTEREEEGTIPFEKVKGAIFQKLMKEALIERTEAWIKELKERAFIDVRL